MVSLGQEKLKEPSMSLVLFEVRDNIALITMNNPDKRNMLTIELCKQIVD